MSIGNIEQADAIIRINRLDNPDTMPEDIWKKTLREWLFVADLKKKTLINTIRQALSDE